MFEKLKAKRRIQKALNQFEKDKLTEEMQRERLLSSKTDVTFLEKVIQQINQNPELKVEIILNDGTILRLKCYNESKKRDFEYLDGVEYGKE